MLVANDVVTDTRVKKEALALAHAGATVTIVGLTSDREPGDSMLGPVRIRRVPVSYARRDETTRQRRQRREWRPARLRRGQRSQRRIVREADTTIRRAWAAWDKTLGQVTARAHWSTVVPEVFDYDAAMSPVIDELAPDAVHAHDMHVIGIADDAARRARAAGRHVTWVYDAHEYVPGLSQYGGRTKRIIKAWATLEAEHIRGADAVVTVSPAIATALHRRYHLSREPAVVLNTPTLSARPEGEPSPSLRAVCGLADDVPLITYSGGVTTARGVDVAVRAMASLPNVHLAVVCVPHNDTWYVRKLRAETTEIGLDAQVHFVNPVGPGEVVDYLRSADVGLIPGLPFPSHHMSLPNKVFEYLYAGVPVVVSELDTLGPFVREHGIGVAFTPGDPAALARAVRTVLADRSRFAARAADPELLDRFSWARQEEVLIGVYERLLGASLAHPPEGAKDRVVDLSEHPMAGEEQACSLER